MKIKFALVFLLFMGCRLVMADEVVTPEDNAELAQAGKEAINSIVGERNKYRAELTKLEGELDGVAKEEQLIRLVTMQLKREFPGEEGESFWKRVYTALQRLSDLEHERTFREKEAVSISKPIVIALIPTIILGSILIYLYSQYKSQDSKYIELKTSIENLNNKS